ncbi:MAG TPA: hypothetical protein VM717_10020 [Chthoniobacterales bacterium]|jgi:hypothetical protein|nr:hypothetical protein [Chthoniobacterales bacterium]
MDGTEFTHVAVNRMGDYVLNTQGPESRHVRAKPQHFTIVSNQTARMDMDIDTGIR